MGTRPTAAAGFGFRAAAYARGRPSYPDDAVAYLAAELGLGPATRVLDLAAGTGKLTRLLVEGGADVVAVEPVAAMRAVLAAAVPGVPVSTARPKRSLLPAASVKLRRDRRPGVPLFAIGTALAEIHRVLRPGGGLRLIWNAVEVGVEWVAVLRELVHAGARARSPVRPLAVAGAPFPASGLFTPLTERTSRSCRSWMRTAWWTGSRRPATWRRFPTRSGSG